MTHNKNLLDYAYRYGQANRRGKIVTSNFANESSSVVLAILLENCAGRTCPHRKPHQLHCRDTNCGNCMLDYADLSSLLRMYGAVVVARLLNAQLRA